ncbi:MAG: CoA transferase [Alphaproteobacteria bacterium]|nr:CoA transferase [Alphaproteobacteria bacterium]
MESQPPVDLPLDGITVLDFSQFLAGPMCAMRLADLGADVIKIERPGSGDLCRKLCVADQWLGEDSLLFHTINRNKKSVVADLKDAEDLSRVKALIQRADVMVHNNRPGVMERIGLGYSEINELNPMMIYGVVSGYGPSGPWKDKPGQDLLAQARSGMTWLSGDGGQGPVPMGISITDITAGAHLVQGILAALFRRAKRGQGALVEVSLVASAMDLQFEQFTSYLHGSRQQPARSRLNGANVNAAAPYGLFRTNDGFIAIAMTPIAELQAILGLETLGPLSDPAVAFARRDEIKQILQDHLLTGATSHWLSLLEPAGLWCSEVLDWPQLEATGALDALEAVQTVSGPQGQDIHTTTCPIRIDGRALPCDRGAPALGADTQDVIAGLSNDHTARGAVA